MIGVMGLCTEWGLEDQETPRWCEDATCAVALVSQITYHSHWFACEQIELPSCKFLFLLTYIFFSTGIMME